MPKLTKATIVAKIQENTGLTKYKAKKGLKTALESIKIALQMGKEVQLPGVGRLVLVERKQKRVIRKHLKGRYSCSIVELNKRHRKSVRLLRGKDMSEDPKPTIVHKNPEPAPTIRRTFAVARPAFRGRPNIPRRTR
jgi:nucleoid DNA-binding protein